MSEENNFFSQRLNLKKDILNKQNAGFFFQLLDIDRRKKKMCADFSHKCNKGKIYCILILIKLILIYFHEIKSKKNEIL